MENKTPAAPAPTGESVANNPTNTNTNEAPAEGVSKTETTTPAANSVDLHGFTPEQLGEMKKFFDNNGGFDSVKSKISNPQKVEPQTTPQPQESTPSNASQPTQNVPSNNSGVRSTTSMITEMYFDKLAQNPQYAGISKEITDGTVIKEMLAMGANPIMADGSVNVEQLTKFLDLKAKGAPAPQTSTTPEASSAPTVDYIQVGETITSQQEALQVLQQNIQLKAMGQAEHPATAKAKEFLKNNKV